MCGRYTLYSDADLLVDKFGLESIPDISPRYNIAPSQPVLVVRQRDDGSRPAAMLRWGLIPGWAKAPAIGQRLINARSETVAEKPAFRSAYHRRRCLLLADGFYEWATSGPASGKHKQPWYFQLSPPRPFAIAGLWERWHDPDGNVIDSCTLLTTSANAVVAPIHHRMPVILPLRHHGVWLDHGNSDPVSLPSLLAPFPDRTISAYAVSDRVNRPANDDAECLAALPQGLNFDD